MLISRYIETRFQSLCDIQSVVIITAHIISKYFNQRGQLHELSKACNICMLYKFQFTLIFTKFYNEMVGKNDLNILYK